MTWDLALKALEVPTIITPPKKKRAPIMRIRREIIDGVEFKECQVCKEMLELKDFNRNVANYDGHCNNCKPCDRAYGRRWWSKKEAAK